MEFKNELKQVVGDEIVQDDFLNIEYLKRMKELPSGINAPSVAHIALNLGSANENYDLFLETLSKYCWKGMKKGDNKWLARKVDSWWKNLKGRKYVYNPEETAKVPNNSDIRMKLFFKVNDGVSKPITLLLEDGEWRVETLSP
ncbi:MAG: hypothetical protein ACFFAS_04780 [Promethearchaeota archaeon]